MHKRTVRITLSLLFATLLVACGGEAIDGRKTATAGAGSAADAATVTAFAISKSSGTASSGTGIVGVANAFATPILVVGTTASGPPSGAFGLVSSTYIDPRGRFQFTIPQGWQATSDADGNVLIAPQLLQGAMQLVILPIGAATTLDEDTDYVMQTIAGGANIFQLIPNSEQSLTIDNQPARRFDFSAAENGILIRHAVYVVKEGEISCTLIFAAVPADFDAVLRQASIVVNTFKFPPLISCSCNGQLPRYVVYDHGETRSGTW